MKNDAPSKTLAFVRMGPFPIPNRLLPIHLEAALPNWQVEVFDIKPEIRRKPLVLLLNLFFLLRENGLHLLGGRLTPWQAFFTTTYMFKKMSAISQRWIERGDFAASIQIQSLFDARTPARPHLVYTDHTHLENLRYPDFDRRSLRRSAWIDLERRLYRNATRLLTRSRNISSSMIEDYGCEPERVQLVGSGSNIDFSVESTAAPDLPSSSGCSDVEGLRILFVGKDWERKGGPDLLEAFERLRRSHPTARLQVVGPTRFRNTPGVEALGHRSLDELRTLYREADIFCLPTRLEPFGVATLEAMHAGLPVVATRVGALPDLVEEGESGLLVEVGDRDALHRALSSLAGDPALRHRMGEAGRSRAVAEFSWERVAERMARIVRFEAMARFEADRTADSGQRIAFVQTGSFSHTNELLLGMLRRNFENAEIDVIDTGQLLMREPFALLSCVAAVVLRYGPQVLLRKHARWRALFGTDLGFRAIRSRLRSRLGSGDYAFTFQTRSLFDASVPGIPHFVYTDHTARMKEQYGLGARELDARIATRWVGLEAAIYRNATCVFTQTDRAARSVIHDYGISADRVECLFGDTNVCRGDSFEEKSYDRKEILYVSGDRHGKGGEQLFEAFEIVRKKHPDARLTVVGPCPDLDLPGIDTVGMVQLAKLGEYYDRATVFCLPTDREPLGYALLEAAENGLPIVSTRVGTMTELVVEGETGLLVAVGDVSGLAEALSTLLASAEMRRDFGRRGYEHIAQTYSWGGAERRLIARLLESLATRAAI